ncbi:MAG: hypothetical protein ACLQL2_11945 [Methylovirgula sp.]
MKKMRQGAGYLAARKVCVCLGFAVLAFGGATTAQAADLPVSSAPSADGYTFSGSPFASWLDMVSAVQAAQPTWMTPLVTVTPRLEQEFRVDFYDQQNGTGSQGNGQHIVNYGGPGGPRVELIPAWNWEVILAPPPYETASGPKGNAQGLGDWPAFLVKYRLLSANKANGDYIVTAFFQMSDPLGTAGKISNHVLTAQPTLAFGKGFGDFDIQSTVSVQVPVGGLSSPGNTSEVNMTNFGDPILWNTTFQYHFMQYFWPELEVNYEHWPNGEHVGLNQVLLTPGIIFGRFKIGQDSPTRAINLIFGVGYQMAVTRNAVTENNLVATTRITF